MGQWLVEGKDSSQVVLLSKGEREREREREKRDALYEVWDFLDLLFLRGLGAKEEGFHCGAEILP